MHHFFKGFIQCWSFHMCCNLTVCSSRLILAENEFNLHVFTAPSVLYGFINPLCTYLSKPSSDKDWQGRCDHATSAYSSANLIQGWQWPANTADQAKHMVKSNIQQVTDSVLWMCVCTFLIRFQSAVQVVERRCVLWSIIYTFCLWPF